MPTQQKYSEDQLVQVLQQHKQSAYEYLYDNYSHALYAVIIQLVKYPEVAEEVLQDTFLKVWNNIGQYDPTKGRLYTWMLQIARNQSIDRLRSKEMNKFRQTKDLDNPVFESAGAVTNPIKDAGLEKLIKELPAESQKLLNLAYFQGYTQEEISKSLNIPLGTIKTRIRTTLIILRKTLGIN